MLYKLYVVHPLAAEDEAFEGCPTHEFIRDFTRELRKSLFTPER